MTRLDRTTLAGLPADIARPSFERAEVGVGVVHLGIGAFHRAHQAVYTDDVLNQTAGDWAICGVSLQSARVRDQMAPQDGLYTVVERGAKGERLRVIGAVKEVVFAPENPGALLARMADPAVKVVTLTVTEKGYCHDPATGRLQADHPDIAHDLANLDRPRTAIGYLVASLAQRRKQGLAPFTVLSCDNIPENGKTVRAIALAFAERLDPGLAAWIADAVSFPCTMVDRIVPATTEDDLAMVEARLGHRDEAALVDALAAGQLGGAELDVYADEPHVPAALIDRDDVMLTPHLGSGTVESRMAMGDMVIENLRRHFAGEPLLTPV